MISMNLFDRFPATPHAQTIQLKQRNMKISWSHAADRALSGLTRPLYVDLQLHFSCLVKKRVIFHSEPPQPNAAGFVPVSDRLFVRFSPVTSVACSLEEGVGGQPVQPVETASVEKMIPRFVYLDFHRGHWRGKYRFR